MMTVKIFNETMMCMYILIYVFIAPFAQSLEDHHPLTDNQMKEVFQSSDTHVEISVGLLYGSSPYHEVISDYQIRDKKGINQLTIRANFGGSNIREINLQSVEGFLAGKDTKVWIAKKINSDETKFNYTLQPDIMEKVNITFYHCNLTQSAITYTTNNEGMSELNGIIDSDKVIGPLKNVRRKRRQVSSEQNNETHKNNFENLHIIYKRETNISDVTQPKQEWFQRGHEDEKISNLGIPDIVYPEILVYVDTSIFEDFNWNVEKTVSYVLTLWNGVDLYYRQLENPKVRLNIAGIVLCQDHVVSSNSFAMYETVHKFAEFMFTEDKFEFKKDYDIATLMIADRLSTGYLAGRVRELRGACVNTSSFINSTFAFRDDTEFSGIFVAVHELAHLFGAVHEPLYLLHMYPDVSITECTQQSIMYQYSTFYNPSSFSTCSKKIMSFFLSREKADCLRNNPAINRTDEQILRILPGAYMSTDEQCQKRGYLRALNETENPHFCAEIRCLKKEGIENITLLNFENGTLEVLDGTPCGWQKFCFNERCVEVTFDKNAESSDPKKLFVPFWALPGFNKSSLVQCKELSSFQSSNLNNCELKCSYSNIINEDINYETFNAADGTSCGANRYCLQGKCVDVLSGIIVDPPKNVQRVKYVWG